MVYTEGERFEALTLAYETYMNFFGFTDDGVHDLLNDNVLLAGRHYEFSALTYSFGGEPVDPTEPPVDPTPVNPPTTGAISVAAIGVLAVVSGAGVVLFRRKK